MATPICHMTAQLSHDGHIFGPLSVDALIYRPNARFDGASPQEVAKMLERQSELEAQLKAAEAGKLRAEKERDTLLSINNRTLDASP